MNQKKLGHLSLLFFTFLIYFTILMIMYIISMQQGTEGSEVSFFAGGDGLFYWKQGQNYALGMPWIRTSIFPLIIGFIIKIFELKSALLIRIFNYSGFILLVVYSLNLVKIQFSLNENIEFQKNRYYAQNLLLVCFLLYVSLQVNINFSILRDVWIYLLYILSVIISIKFIFYNTNRFLNIFILIFITWLLGEFRSYAMLSFWLSIGVYFVFLKLKTLFKLKSLVLISLAIFIIYYHYFIDFSILGLSLRNALKYREQTLDLFAGGSQMWIKLNQSNEIIFIINYIHSFFGNLIGPLPWHISGVSTLFVFFVETIPMTFILIYLWRRKHFLTQVQKYILLHGFVWNSLIGFTNDNIGTATRLRPITWILFLIVFVFVFSNKNIKKLRLKSEVVIDESITNHK